MGSPMAPAGGRAVVVRREGVGEAAGIFMPGIWGVWADADATTQSSPASTKRHSGAHEPTSFANNRRHTDRRGWLIAPRLSQTLVFRGTQFVFVFLALLGIGHESPFATAGRGVVLALHNKRERSCLCSSSCSRSWLRGPCSNPACRNSFREFD